MKRAAIGFPMAFVLTFMPLANHANHANAADDPEQPIATRDLKTLQIPGKVTGVLWTVRPERCTLQIVFPNAGRLQQTMADHQKLRQPSIQAWLLSADGSAISSIGRWEPGDHAKSPRQPFGVEVLLAFPRLADKEAVAVALRVDDVFLIERLPHVPM